MGRINSDEIKVCDFGLSQRIIPGINYYVEFGHPEFVAPEIVDKQVVTFVSDAWSGNGQQYRCVIILLFDYLLHYSWNNNVYSLHWRLSVFGRQ